MAIMITQDCINCGACEPVCPTQAITGEGTAGTIFVIDPKACTECVGHHGEPACQSECPVECCLPDEKNMETEEDLIARALRLCPDDEELRARVDSGVYPSRFRTE
ncbi:YfhL family 4Fe-4S dicluster ferredoxin [Embleya sp. AB8]|uniref:YfhL family 4Fe-4S dicluster ferredoxin n=1 Tax=Embleya sp. AB8 TaxID=3156304 RepID=UPI003C7869B1